MSEKREFTIYPGSVVEANWQVGEQDRVEPIDVIVLNPNPQASNLATDLEDSVSVAEHSRVGDLQIISAVGEILPSAVLGLVDKDPYTLEKVHELLRNGQDVAIPNPVLGMHSARAGTQIRQAIKDNVTREISQAGE